MTDAGITWTDERVDILKKLWSDGLSASQIAAEIGGVSRNAVIGKVHRLGLSGRGKSGAPAAGAPRVRKAPTRTPTHPMSVQAPAAAQPHAALAPVALSLVRSEAAPETATPRDIALPPSERVTIMDLREYMCRWPLGDPTTAEFRFCGGRAITGLPYCPHHSQVAYQPAAERRRDRRVARA